MSPTVGDMPAKPRRGAPAGLLLNPVAARHHLGKRPQTWLAAEAGVSTALLSTLMSGGRGASRETAHSLAAALEVPVELLFPELVEFSTTIRHFTAPKLDEVA